MKNFRGRQTRSRKKTHKRREIESETKKKTQKGEFVRKKRVHEDSTVRRLVLTFAKSGGVE